jgi:hypothetical protein
MLECFLLIWQHAALLDKKARQDVDAITTALHQLDLEQLA